MTTAQFRHNYVGGFASLPNYNRYIHPGSPLAHQDEWIRVTEVQVGDVAVFVWIHFVHAHWVVPHSKLILLRALYHTHLS